MFDLSLVGNSIGGLLMVVSYAVNMNIQFMAPKTFGAFEVGDRPPTGKRDDERLNFIFPTF